MPTAQVAAEQIVIGAMVLAAAAMPWSPELHGRLAGNPLVSGGVVLGICYVLGVLFDRIADTFTEELDRHHRLRFGLAQRLKKPRASDPPADPYPDDVFAEDRFRLSMLRDKEPVVTWLDYHRSRVRLTRALAVYLPAVTVAAVIASSRMQAIKWQSGVALDPLWILIVPLVLVVFGVRSALRTSGNREKTWEKRWLAVPTFSDEVPAYRSKHGFVDNNGESRRQRGTALAEAVLTDPSVQAGVVLLLTALVLAARSRWPATILSGLAGATLSVMSALAWWRISSTFRSYLSDFARHPGATAKTM